MAENPNPQPVIPPEASVPWTVRDTWIGVWLLVLVEIVLVVILLALPEIDFVQSAGLIAIELVYLLPVATVFLWRASGWNFIGFRRFRWQTLGLGYGLLIGVYALVFVHNSILAALGFETQGDLIVTLFSSLHAPGWLLFVGIFLAPFVEEVFFRGFLFQGFRTKMGWVRAALLSSAIFSLGHLSPTSLIPTFLLGFTFSYIFHRSNSLWPGTFLHMTVNGFGLCVALAATQYPGLFQ